MDKLSELFSNIKERLTSPLFFSFLISWLIINWEVAVALVWYDPKEIRDAGFENIFDFVGINTSWWESFWLPFVIGVGYTLFYPPIKSAINVFQVWVYKMEERKSLQISAGSSVPMEKYISLNTEFTERNKKLQEIIEQDSKNIAKAMESENEKLKALSQLQESELKLKEQEKLNKVQLEKLEKITDASILNGKWYFQMLDGGTEIEIEIVDNKLIIPNHEGNRFVFFEMKYFFFDSFSENELIFTLERNESAHRTHPKMSLLFVQAPIIVTYLKKNGNELRGTQNGVLVYFRKFSKMKNVDFIK